VERLVEACRTGDHPERPEGRTHLASSNWNPDSNTNVIESRYRFVEPVMRAAASRVVGAALLERYWRALSARVPGRARGMMIQAFTEEAVRRGVTRRTFTIGSAAAVVGDLRDFTWATAYFLASPYEPETTAFLQGHLKPGMRFVDVGANAGYFSILAARQTGTTGHVVAIEPAPALSARIRELARLNGVAAQVTVSEVALAADNGEAGFFRSPDAWNTGLGSLAQRDIHVADARITVRTRRYDDHVPQILGGAADVIKIDVETIESDVLLGAERTLAESPPAWIILESKADGPAARMLIERGFHVQRELDRTDTGTPNLLMTRTHQPS
jgi:FkbM family methyltransferase